MFENIASATFYWSSKSLRRAQTRRKEIRSHLIVRKTAYVSKEKGLNGDYFWKLSTTVLSAYQYSCFSHMQNQLRFEV